MKITKWLKRQKSSVNLCAGDTISVDYTNSIGERKTLIDTTPIEKSMSVDEVGIFEGKVGDKDALGAVLMGKKKK